MTIPPFHISFEVSKYDESVNFYTLILGGLLDSDHKHWCNINLHGHQLTLHKKRNGTLNPMPNFHWGLNVDAELFTRIENRLRAIPSDFILAPDVQNSGTANARKKMIFHDPNGYVLEFKARLA